MSQALIRYALIGFVLIGLSAVVYACGRATNTTTGATELERLSIGTMEGMDFAFKGKPAPADTFLSPTGEQISVADFNGKIVILNIWATWCPPCEAEMPSLAALHTARGSDDFAVAALSIDEMSDREFTRGQLEKLSGGALDFYQAESLQITYSLGVSGFPTTIIYDKDSREIARFIGDTDWANYEAIAFVDALLER